jgi:hypothetical protein
MLLMEQGVYDRVGGAVRHGPVVHALQKARAGACTELLRGGEMGPWMKYFDIEGVPSHP